MTSISILLDIPSFSTMFEAFKAWSLNYERLTREAGQKRGDNVENRFVNKLDGRKNGTRSIQELEDNGYEERF